MSNQVRIEEDLLGQREVPADAYYGIHTLRAIENFNISNATISSEPEFVRGMIMRLPRAFWPIPPAYGHVIAFTEDGKVVEDLQDPSGAYPETTSAVERPDALYIQSLHAHSIGWMKRP